MKKPVAKKKSAKKKSVKGGHKPYSVTHEKFEVIVKHISMGFDIKDACEREGVSHEAYYQYMKRNPKKTDLHRSALYRKEELAYKSMDVGMVKDWKAAAWWLERTKPERFREKKEIELTKPSLIEGMFSDDDDDKDNGK